jgi:hypothetical protein
VSSRWDEPEDSGTVLRRFKNALVNGLDSSFGEGTHYDPELERHFAIIHGSPYGAASDIRQVIRKVESRNKMESVSRARPLNH